MPMQRVAYRAFVSGLWCLAIVAICVCACRRARTIETDLLVRSQTALIDARIAYHGVTFEGRDAVLATPAAPGEDGVAVAELIAAVPGVRRVVVAVRDEEGRARDDSVGSAPTVERGTSRPAAPPWVRIERSGEHVRVDGQMPEPASDRLLARLRERFTSVESRIDRSAPIEEDVWSERAAELADLVIDLDDGRVSVFDHVAMLVGTAARARDIADLEARASGTFPLLAWAFRLRAHPNRSPPSSPSRETKT
jgi:hypothetical protein